MASRTSTISASPRWKCSSSRSIPSPGFFSRKRSGSSRLTLRRSEYVEVGETTHTSARPGRLAHPARRWAERDRTHVEPGQGLRRPRPNPGARPRPDVKLTLHAPYYVDFFGSEESRDREHPTDPVGGTAHVGVGRRPGRHTPRILWRRLAGRQHSRIGPGGAGARNLASEDDRRRRAPGHRAERPPRCLRVARGGPRAGASIKGIVPVLNLPHLAARERTTFNDQVQLKALVDQFVEASHGDLYLNFSGSRVLRSHGVPANADQARLDPLRQPRRDPGRPRL